MFSHFEATLLGSVLRIREEGRNPLPWISFRVETYGSVWSAFGKMEAIKIHQDVVLQGAGNIEAIRPKLKPNAEVFVKGQMLPYYAVASDSKDKSPRVIAASVVQINEREEEA